MYEDFREKRNCSLYLATELFDRVKAQGEYWFCPFNRVAFLILMWKFLPQQAQLSLPKLAVCHRNDRQAIRSATPETILDVLQGAQKLRSIYLPVALHETICEQAKCLRATSDSRCSFNRTVGRALAEYLFLGVTTPLVKLRKHHHEKIAQKPVFPF